MLKLIKCSCHCIFWWLLNTIYCSAANFANYWKVLGGHGSFCSTSLTNSHLNALTLRMWEGSSSCAEVSQQADAGSDPLLWWDRRVCRMKTTDSSSRCGPVSFAFRQGLCSRIHAPTASSFLFALCGYNLGNCINYALLGTAVHLFALLKNYMPFKCGLVH